MRIPSFFASFEKRFASRCHRRTAMPIDPSPWRSRYPKQQHPIDSRLPTFFFLSHHIISNHPLTTHYSLLTTTSTTTTTMKFPLLFSRSSRSSSSSSSCWSSFSTTVLLLVAVVGTSNLPTCHSSSAAAAGSAALSSALKNIDYRYFVAGGTCAAFSHGITTPIDVVKTKIQANPKVKLKISNMYFCIYYEHET
jgi:Mitochondrial carrier protein